VTEQSRFHRFRARLDDWINPIVVKELRQAVQSRFVVAALLILLTIQLSATGIYLLVSESPVMDFEAGWQVFSVLYGVLLGVSMLFVPLYTAIRIIAERSDNNIDLLFITTIKPRSIVAGKLIAATILTILTFSACMPFMVFTYFLRGIDLPSIFVVLILGFLIVIVCSQLGIFIASIPVNRIFKLLFGIIGFLAFLMIYFAVMASVSNLIRTGIGSRVDNLQFWEGVIGFLGLIVFMVGVFFTSSVALITPVAANRALPVRLFITIAWPLSVAGVLLVSFYEKFHRPVILWLVLFNSIFAVAIFVAVSERDRLGRRVLRSIPPSRMRRALAFPVFSGAASGLLWSCTGICLSLLVAWIWSRLFPLYQGHVDLVEILKWIGAMCLYFFCYAMSAAVIRRRLSSRVDGELTWLIGLILMLIGIILPFMTGYLFFFEDKWWNEDYGKWLVGNPFAWRSRLNMDLYLGVAAVWALLAAALNMHWFLEGVRSFRPLRRQEEDEGRVSRITQQPEIADSTVRGRKRPDLPAHN
jgi:hypothetical protein